jgi:predicted transcriptional regulator
LALGELQGSTNTLLTKQLRNSQFANHEFDYLYSMRKHNGMRPQDIVILLKIITKGSTPWQNKDLSQELNISQSEISDSLNRSAMAGLIESDTKKKVYRQSLMEFIQHGLHYVFPATPTGMVNGIYTAHSHPFMKNKFKNIDTAFEYVWPDFKGEVRGLAIEPLYKETVKAIRQDQNLYKMLALIDVIRVGRVREFKVAIEELEKMILHEPSAEYNTY